MIQFRFSVRCTNYSFFGASEIVVRFLTNWWKSPWETISFKIIGYLFSSVLLLQLSHSQACHMMYMYEGGQGWGGGSCHGIMKSNFAFQESQNAILRFHDLRKFKNYKCRNHIKFEEKSCYPEFNVIEDI